MACLAQTLAHHGSILVLDTASTRVQVGLLRHAQQPRWRALDDEAGQAIFAGTSALLAETACTLDGIGAFLYCEGPGSMLGIRTVAMVLRTWNTLLSRPAYSYQSLALAARAEWRRHSRPLTVLADARRDAWHCQSIRSDGGLEPLRRVAGTELPMGELLTPEHFRAWSALPPGVRTCSYDLPELFAATEEDDLLHESAVPDAYQIEAPEYRKWSAQPHSAATALRP